MTILASDDQTLLFAAEMVRHGFRTPIITKASKISTRRIQKLYRSIHGASPPVGSCYTPSSYAGTWDQLAQAGIFVDIYHKLYGEQIYHAVHLRGSILRVSCAHQHYIILHRQTNQLIPPLNVNVAYEIAVGLVEKTIHRIPCSADACLFPAVVIAEQRKPMACPLCHTPLR